MISRRDLLLGAAVPLLAAPAPGVPPIVPAKIDPAKIVPHDIAS
jgi:hypothetical protein